MCGEIMHIIDGAAAWPEAKIDFCFGVITRCFAFDKTSDILGSAKRSSTDKGTKEAAGKTAGSEVKKAARDPEMEAIGPPNMKELLSKTSILVKLPAVLATLEILVSNKVDP